jgi:restriction system protein
MTELWGIHIFRENGADALDKGYIAIGWEEMGDLSSIALTRDAFKSAYANVYPEAKQGTIPVAAGVLFRFVAEMQVGDFVVLPSRHDRMVNIGKIDSAYYHESSETSALPNRRRVTWLRHIPRSYFSQDARNEIGSAITLFQISNNKSEFMSALHGQISEPQSIDDTSAVRVSEQVEETTEDFIINRLKTSQNPYQFEHFIAHLLRCMGYHARVTQASGDGGVDIIAHRDELGFDPPLIKVQVKQIISTIGSPEVQQLIGAVGPGEKALFVTLGSFSRDARSIERSNPNLRLIDGAALIELVYAHYHQFEPRYQMLLPLKRSYIPGAIIE